MLQAGGSFQIVAGLSLRQVVLGFFNGALLVVDCLDGLLFSVPLGGERMVGFPQIGELAVDYCQAFGRSLIRFALERLLLNFQLHDGPFIFIQSGRPGIHLNVDRCGGFIHQINRFIRQEPIRDVPVRQPCRRYQGVIVNTHAMEDLKSFLQPAQDRDSLSNTGFLDQDPLETAFEGFVFLDPLTVLIQRCRSDQMQFAPGEHRFQQVAGIHAAFRLAGTDNVVDLINEQDDLTIALLDFI